MKATFITTKKGIWACIQKSIRVDGKSTSITIKKLGLLDDIQKEHGCADPKQWVRDLAAKLTLEEKEQNKQISIEFAPNKLVDMGSIPLRHGGDLMMLSTYTKLGLPQICKAIASDTRVKYDLDEILRTLVFSRVLSPCSKIGTHEFAKSMVMPPKFSESDMYRSLSLLSSHIDDIQADIYKRSKEFMQRKERVIYFDCSNYYFEIEDNDRDSIDADTGEIQIGLRKRGKSKENRPNPIVQMGLFMDGDGIPLAFEIFPGNESEQVWLQPLERILDKKFDMTDFVVSTDAGLASEDNRRYNMAEGRNYICVQSLPSLKREDQDMALQTEGWSIAFPANDADVAKRLPTDDVNHKKFDLKVLLEAESKNPGILKDITFYREILVDKQVKYDNPTWIEMEKKNPREKHVDKDSKAIPKQLSIVREERVIVTYNHDFALYLKRKRAERLKQSNAIVRNKDEKGRHSQQSPRKYVKTVHKTSDGNIATKLEMAIDEDIIKNEEKFDGFYAYGTSLDDDAIDILKARSFHHEIEHLFRTTKTLLNARPVYLSRPDRIKSHFLICFLAMTILKIMQKQINKDFAEHYKDEPLTIDALTSTLQSYRFANLQNQGYVPMYTRTPLTDQLQALAGVEVNTQIITPKAMKKAYRTVKL
jgi:transposase